MYDTATRVALVKRRVQEHHSGEAKGFVDILVHFHAPEEQAALCGMLRDWMELSCVSMDILPVRGNAVPLTSAIIFWDLDSPIPPPPVHHVQDCALFLCSRDPQRAIDSYSFHPAGFLTKPISRDHLWNAMHRCADFWFSSLLRLEVLSDRVKIGIPFRNLIWVEGTRRGCLIHTSHQSITAREPLYQLEQRLPEAVFTRCQRSFLVNLTHVREISGGSLFLNDGTELSLGRGNKAQVLESYRLFCRRRHGQ